MSFTPSGDVNFYSVPFNATNVLSKKFTGTPLHTVSNVLTTKDAEGSSIKVKGHADSFRDSNYISFKNTSSTYSSITFYAFITAIKYISPNCAEVQYKIDYYQSFFSEITYLPCMVEREHVDSDNVGEHLIDEGINFSDYVVHREKDVELTFKYGYAKTIKSDATKMYDTGYGVPSGLEVRCYDTIGGLNSAIGGLSDDDRDLIAYCFMFPSQLCQNEVIGYIDFPVGGINNITYGSTLNGYQPHNNKLLSYPYCMLQLTDNTGKSNTYRYEKFSSDTSFTMKGVVDGAPQAIIYPNNYNGSNNNYDEGIVIDYPTFSFSNNNFDSYIAQNKTAMGINALSSVASGALAGAKLGGGVGAIGGALLSSGNVVSSMVADMSTKSYAPYSQKGSSSGMLAVRSGQSTLKFQVLTIPFHDAKRIDEFFTMYGYKVCQLKKPNITGRPTWNYVKCQNAVIKGNIPDTGKREICDMLNNGVTFWHSLDTFGDYSQSNDL